MDRSLRCEKNSRHPLFFLSSSLLLVLLFLLQRHEFLHFLLIVIYLLFFSSLGEVWRITSFNPAVVEFWDFCSVYERELQSYIFLPIFVVFLDFFDFVEKLFRMSVLIARLIIINLLCLCFSLLKKN